AGFELDDLGGPQRRERHRSEIGRALRYAVVEIGHGTRPHPVLRCPTSRGAERPDAAPPAVLDRVPTVPVTVRRPTVPRATRRVLRRRQEPERGTGEFTHRLTVVRLPDGHDQQTGHVV